MGSPIAKEWVAASWPFSRITQFVTRFDTSFSCSEDPANRDHSHKPTTTAQQTNNRTFDNFFFTHKTPQSRNKRLAKHETPFRGSWGSGVRISDLAGGTIPISRDHIVLPNLKFAHPTPIFDTAGSRPSTAVEHRHLSRIDSDPDLNLPLSSKAAAMRHVTRVCLCVVVLSTVILPQVWAQAVKEPTAITGKISGIERKGKTTTVTVKGDTDEQVIELTAKVAVEITSEGDDGFLIPGLFVKVDAVETNKKYFGNSFEVFPQMTGKIPPAAAVKPPGQPGQSVNRYIVSGEIVKHTPPADGEKYGHMELRQAGKATLSVLVEPQHAVKVVLSDPATLEGGQTAIVTGRKSGDKFVAQKFAVTTTKKLKADESLDDLTGKKKKK